MRKPTAGLMIGLGEGAAVARQRMSPASAAMNVTAMVTSPLPSRADLRDGTSVRSWKIPSVPHSTRIS
ncbi:MAG: hypothetical protein R3F43_17395 [bacterium]